MSGFVASMPGNRAMRSFFDAVNLDPGTIAIVAQVASVASTAMSVVGAISSAQAEKASYKSQQQAALANEKILRDNAAQASREASAQEDELRRRQRVIRGNQVAGIAQSGIGFEGTGGDLLEQSDINASLDNLSVRYEGEMRARNLTTQAGMSAFDAAVAGNNAKAAGNSGYFSAIGAGVKGASSYAQWQRDYAPKNNTLN